MELVTLFWRFWTQVKSTLPFNTAFCKMLPDLVIYPLLGTGLQVVTTGFTGCLFNMRSMACRNHLLTLLWLTSRVKLTNTG